MKIAFLDVGYQGTGARAACVVADSWTADNPVASYVAAIDAVDEYEPGAFYRRELPCLLRVLALLPAPPDVVVIDGYVWLSDEPKPGLGAHLYQAVARRFPVIGVAKTAFHGVDDCALVSRVVRGSSEKPLYVSATGVELSVAAGLVREMAGPYRMPSLLTITDQLSRSDVQAA
jgi:deoxyribonuclease V